VEANPMKSLSRDLQDNLDKARAFAAKFLGADLDGFAFVKNATTAANTVLSSSIIRPGDEVLVSDQTYGAVKFAAERVCRARSARLITAEAPLPEDGSAELVEKILAKVTCRTRLAVVDHIASPTGLVFPVKKLIAELRRKRVLVMVDAAHAPGMVDVDLADLDPDFWTGNFHKWCCAPRGSAGLWVREDHRRIIEPLVASWQLEKGYPASFGWLGTDDYTPYLTVPAAIKFMEGLSWERIKAHNRRLARYGRDKVGKALGTEPVLPGHDEMFDAMTLVRLPKGHVKNDDDARVLQARLAKLGLEASPTSLNGNGYLRLSAQVYNAPDEYDRLASVVPDLFRTSK
jgi:isopenicillin-N epimerase